MGDDVMRVWSRLVPIAVATAVSACGAPSDEADEYGPGVTVVSTAAPLWETAQPWVLAGAPTLSVGLVEGDLNYLFGAISGVVALDDGIIVVADGQSHQLRFFDARGAFLRSVGGEGQGPGEFKSFGWIARCNGALFVHDWQQRRVSIWSEAGEFRDSFSLFEPGGDRAPYRARCGPDGTFVLAGWGEFQTLPRGETFHYFGQSAPVWLSDPQGDSAIELGDYITSERVQHVNTQTGGGGSSPHPFSRSVVFAQGEEKVYVGSSERLEVEVFDRDGRLIRVQRGPDADLIIDDSFLSGYRTAAMSRPDSLMRNRLIDADLPMPPRLPAYTEFIVDPQGNLWVERFRTPWAGANRWGVFSESGDFYGHLEMPEGFQLMYVANDYVVGVTRDDFDVERVEVYDLTR